MANSGLMHTYNLLKTKPSYSTKEKLELSLMGTKLFFIKKLLVSL